MHDFRITGVESNLSFYKKLSLIKINREKRKAALKNEAGRDEKHLFLLLGLTEI